MNPVPAEYLLTLIGAPGLQDPVADWLLEQPAVRSFTTVPAFGHGEASQRLSLIEQVSGRQRRFLLYLHASPETIETLLAGLRTAFAGAALHYWVQPVTAAGHLGEA